MTPMSTLRGGRLITVTPLRTFPVIRDLVTDVSLNYQKAREMGIQVLETLMRAPDAVVSREDLLEQAWVNEEPMSNTVDVLIGRLRKKMVAAGSATKIETVRGMGYRVQPR